MRRKKLGAGVATITAAVGLLLSPSTVSAQASGGATWVTYGAPPAVRSLATLPPEVQDLAHAASELTEAHKSDFLGSFVQSDDRVVVVAASPDGTALATDEFAGNPKVVVRQADTSIESAEEIGRLTSRR